MITRNGKIARLPRAIREQLNRRMQDGEPQNKLVEWLNSLPEVQAILDAEFEGRPISEQNLSEWKAGGYRDWVALQEAIETVKNMDGEVEQLGEITKLPLVELLAKKVTLRYVLASRALSQYGAEEVDLKTLRDFCQDVVALRKGDHSAERLKLERERLEQDREELRELREEEFRAWADQHREEVCEGYKPRTVREQALHQILYEKRSGRDEDEEGTVTGPGEGI